MTDCISLNGTSSRVACLTREKETKRTQERRRNLEYLVAAFLCEQGYTITVNAFSKEAQLSRDVQVCDNIDLETILLEYSDYYYAKFNKYPKLCKKVDSSSCSNAANNTTNRKGKATKIGMKENDEGSVMKSKASQKDVHGVNDTFAQEINLGMTITPMFPFASDGRAEEKSTSEEFTVQNEKMVKSIADLYPCGSEWREIADVISKEIVTKDLHVHWDDIKGYDECKRLLKEATVYPLKYPSLFNGKLDCWKGILLYGPPGTGKTMLAKAVATECKSTFFNITSSSIISKWRGDSEKYIRVLFDLAKYYSPTIIFIDEIDWTTATSRDSSPSYSEPARRFRAEFLARLDGLLSLECANVILLAATNIPWNIDIALLRRLEKRIFVNLPDRSSRLEILRFYVRKDLHDNKDFQLLVEHTDGYSCADLKLLCKEARMNELRPLWNSLENKAIAVHNVQIDGVINSMIHLRNAMKYVKPISKHVSEQYTRWNEEFGSYV